MSDMPSTNTSDYWICAFNQSEIYRPMSSGKGGKWMIFESFDKIDNVWATIKKATEEGKLGNEAKVGTRKESGIPGAVSWRKVICIFTYDWTDEEDVMRVRQALRELGFTRKLSYKSNADTAAGRYRATGHSRISKYYC